VSGMVTYAWRHGEQEIPHGPVRRRMALHRPSPARAHRTRTPQAARPEGDPGRRLLRAQERLPLAVVAEGLRTPWKTVYDWFRGWRIDGTWQRLNAELRGRLRRRLGTPARQGPESQRGRRGLPVSEDHGGGSERGFDPAKQVAGRKRHLLVDTEGLVLEARVHSARVPDQDGIRLLLDPARERLGRLSHLWVDAGYQGRARRWAEEVMGLSVEVVRKPQKPVPEKVAELWAAEWTKEGKEVDWRRLMPPKGFKVLPKGGG
jgi:putative transposase